MCVDGDSGHQCEMIDDAGMHGRRWLFEDGDAVDGSAVFVGGELITPCILYGEAGAEECCVMCEGRG